MAHNIAPFPLPPYITLMEHILATLHTVQDINKRVINIKGAVDGNTQALVEHILGMVPGKLALIFGR